MLGWMATQMYKRSGCAEIEVSTLFWNDTIGLVDGMFDLGILPYDYQSKKTP